MIIFKSIVLSDICDFRRKCIETHTTSNLILIFELSFGDSVMNIAESISSMISGLINRILSSLGHSASTMAYSASRSAADAVGKTASNVAKSALAKPDDEIKKISFSKNSSGGYDLIYNSKMFNSLTKNELKLVEGKQRADALLALKAVLRSKHESFKMDKVLTTIAEKILDDLGIK